MHGLKLGGVTQAHNCATYKMSYKTLLQNEIISKCKRYEYISKETEEYYQEARAIKYCWYSCQFEQLWQAVHLSQ